MPFYANNWILSAVCSSLPGARPKWKRLTFGQPRIYPFTTLLPIRTRRESLWRRGTAALQSLCICDQSDLSLEFSISQSHLVAVVALKVEFNSTFEPSLKTRRMAANCLGTLVADQSDCNGLMHRLIAPFVKKNELAPALDTAHSSVVKNWTH